MSRCPHLEYKDTSYLFGFREYCEITGVEVGNNYDQVKVKALCKNEYRDCYRDCPLYQAKHY